MSKLAKGAALLLLIMGLLISVQPVQAAGEAEVAADFTVKVRLVNQLGPTGTYHFTPQGDSVLAESPKSVLVKGTKYTVTVVNQKFTVKAGTELVAENLAQVTIEPAVYAEQNHLYLYKGSSTTAYPYMGTVLFRLHGTANIQPVNKLNFEDYLKGVVPAESVPSWGATGGMEALKAQAVAARSYVFAKMQGNPALEIDDTTSYQVYKGFIWSPLSPRYSKNYTYTNQAVEQTKGDILTYTRWNGTTGVVTTFFSSSNGGQTELAEQYWSSPLPYVTKSQADPFDTTKTWKLTWLKQQLSSELDLANPADWWASVKERSLNATEEPSASSRSTFQKYKDHLLKQLKADNPAINDIKITEITDIQTKDYSNTGKVQEISISLNYLAQLKTDNEITYDIVPGAASKTLSGTSRYETAVSIAKEYVGSKKANAVVFGRGDVPADALAGTVLAHAKQAPVLLVRQASIPATVQEFMNTNVTPGATVYLLGGTLAISPDIEKELKRQGFNPVRLSGKDRTATSLAIANEVGRTNQVIIASGDDNSSDALSASAYAAANGIPIIIQRGTWLTSEATDFMKAGGVSSAVIIGGTGAVPETVISQLGAAGISSKRISGSDRVGTSIEINNKLPMPGNNLVIGNAYNFIDALAGSVLAAKTNSPIMLVHPDATRLPSAFLEALPSKQQVYYLGGSKVISADLEHAISQYVGGSVKTHSAVLTFRGSDTREFSPTMTSFRTTLGGTLLKSVDFDIEESADRFVFNGAGYGHGIGLSQWGAYGRAVAGQSVDDILNFYFQGVKKGSTQDFFIN